MRDPAFLASLATSVLEQAGFFVVYADSSHRVLHIDDRFAALIGGSADALIGRSLAEIDHPCAESIMRAAGRVAVEGGTAAIDCLISDGDGQRTLLAGSLVAHQDRAGEGAGEGAGAPLGYLCLLHDVGDEDRINDFLTRRDQFVTTLLDAAVDGIIIADARGGIRSINRACCQLFGYDEMELLGANLTVLMPPPFSRDHDHHMRDYLETGRAKIIGIGRETLGKRKDGRVFPIHISVGRAQIANQIVFVGVIRDISDRLAAEQRASYLARHDPLTGVLTRTAFLEECQAHLTRAADQGQEGCYALYSLDVDQFSDINEAFGFHVGDAALKVLVSRVVEVLPRETILCRVAADEFAALALVRDVETARALAGGLFDRLTASIYADRHWVRLRVSLGAAVFDDTVQRVEELNAKAKLALQAVQHGGGNAVCFYTPEMAAAATRRMLLTTHLAHAIERDQLHLAYQPIVEAESGRVTSAEALLRWRHPGLGAISPCEFIPVAEECGLIVPITDWILATVVHQMIAWDAEGILPDRVFVNISGQQFLRGNLTHHLAALLQDRPELKRHLGLEITEQAAVRDLRAAVRTLGELTSIGVQVAIDDFGSGYSSLSYVQQLPVAKLKIDRAFIVDVPDNLKNVALVRAIVGMAHGLGLVTVAEGVETVEQHDFLRSVGCDQLQGYLFGFPMPPADLARVMRANPPAQ